MSEKHFWENSNSISDSDLIVDSPQAYTNHYNWANKGSHPLKRRKRYTLKGDSEKSFQPQSAINSLIDILPFLNKNGLEPEELINSITSKRGSRPFKLSSDLGNQLYDFLYSESGHRVKGSELKNLHP